MFGLFQRYQSRDVLAAIEQTQAVIEFDLQGNIRRANDNFLALFGYSLDEIAAARIVFS